MDWKGLFTGGDPHDLPEGAAVAQDNAECRRPGMLDVRGGSREVWFENLAARGQAPADITGLPDLLAIASFNRPEGLLLLTLDDEGNVRAGRCPV